MQVNGPKAETSVPYKLQCTSLKPVREVRDLGFYINTNLDFSSYCRTLVRKANYSIYTLFRLLRSKDPQVYLRVYKSYVRPIMEPEKAVWNPCKKKDIEFLESVQNSFTRKLYLRCYGQLLAAAQFPWKCKSTWPSNVASRRRKLISL